MSGACRRLRWFKVAIAAAAMGFAIGLGVMGVFDAAYGLIDLLWVKGWSVFGAPWYPLVMGAVAGAALAIVVPMYGRPAASAGVLGKRENAGTRNAADASAKPLGSRRPLPVAVAEFLIPFAGGAPVGVAMGVVGFVRRGAAWVKRRVRNLCAKAGLADEGSAFTRCQKIVVYGSGIAGGVLGGAVVVEVLGLGVMVPRFDAALATPENLALAVGLGTLGWALGLVYLLFSRAAERLWSYAGKIRRFLPLACGLVLGAFMAFMPHVGLPGSDAFSCQILAEWPFLPPIILVATALVRTALIALLLNLGWGGGPFFPLVYSALCLGFGLSSLVGIEPGLAAAALGAGVLVSFSGKAIMGVAIFLCCPFESLPIVLAACATAAGLTRARAAAARRLS